MVAQLDMFAPPIATPKRKTWGEFLTESPRVRDVLLRLTRDAVERGDKYLSAKWLFETLRRDPSLRTDGANGWKLDNDMTADCARWLADEVPGARELMRFRKRRGE